MKSLPVGADRPDRPFATVRNRAGVTKIQVASHPMVRCDFKQVRFLDLPGKSGEHQLRNQEVFYGKREQTDAGVSA
jgi:hypothetical protein